MILHRLANALLKALMPLSAIRQAQAFGWDHEEKWLSDESWLTDVEADHDVWEADELWAAHHNFTAAPTTARSADSDGTTLPPEVVRPTDDAASAGHVVGGAPLNDGLAPGPSESPAGVGSNDRCSGSYAGGAFKSDEQIIHELVEDYRQFLRQCFGK